LENNSSNSVLTQILNTDDFKSYLSRYNNNVKTGGINAAIQDILFVLYNGKIRHFKKKTGHTIRRRKNIYYLCK